VEAYPNLSEEDVRAAILYAGVKLKHEKADEAGDLVAHR
jgi:uncharacterized protein (DUF433 family)